MQLPRSIIIALTLAFTATNAIAQTNAALMVLPWTGDHRAEVQTDFHFQAEGDTDRPGGRGNDVQLSQYDVQGRVSLDPENNYLRLGFKSNYVDIDSSDPILPERLVDQSLAVGFGIGEFDDWKVAAVVGGGFAGDLPYTDDDAWYGKADIMAVTSLSETEKLLFTLNYNGNRTIFPDIPLLLIEYNVKVSDNFEYTLGLPLSRMTWRPADRWEVKLFYAVPTTISASIDYEFIDNWHIYAAFTNRLSAYHVNGDDEHRRYFLRQRRIEAGVRWEIAELGERANAELTLAGGYAFDQEFMRGFDVRDLETLREVSDEPFVRAAFRINF